MPDSVDVLVLSHRYDVKGGAEKALLETISHIRSAGYSVHVIIGDRGNITDKLDEMGATYSIVFLPFWMHSGDDPSDFHFTSLNPSVNTVLQITNLVQSLNPRLCITNTIVCPWLAYASSLVPTPHLWYIHELESAFNFRFAVGKQTTYQSIGLLSDYVVYNSQHTADFYRDKISTLSPRIIYPYSISASNTAERTTTSNSDVLSLVSVGQIKPQKAQFDLVRAVQILVQQGIQVQAVFLGDVEDDAYMAQMSEYIDQHNLTDAIHFAGQVDDPLSYMRNADILVNSASEESFGRVSVEAMSCGALVIAADSGGSKEIITHLKNGLLYKPGDYTQLADAIMLVQQDTKLATKLRQAGVSFVRKQFSEQSRFKALDTILANPTLSDDKVNLSALNSLVIDFRSTATLLERSQNELHQIQRSKSYRVLSGARKVLKRQ